MSAIEQALRIAHMTYFPVTWAERQTCIEEAHEELLALRSRVVELEAENRSLLLSRNGLEVGYKKQSKEIIRLERIIDKARASQKLPT